MCFSYRIKNFTNLITSDDVFIADLASSTPVQFSMYIQGDFGIVSGSTLVKIVQVKHPILIAKYIQRSLVYYELLATKPLFNSMQLHQDTTMSVHSIGILCSILFSTSHFNSSANKWFH